MLQLSAPPISAPSNKRSLYTTDHQISTSSNKRLSPQKAPTSKSSEMGNNLKSYRTNLHQQDETHINVKNDAQFLYHCIVIYDGKCL